MATLHIINQKPSNPTWRTLFECLNAEDAILLIEDACYADLDEAIVTKLNTARTDKGVSIYVLESDRKARGLTTPSSFATADYAKFVSLVADYDKTISWHA